MRSKEVWDDWMKYDEDGFYSGIRDDAPEDVKKAYAEHIEKQEKEKKNGYVMR